MPAQDGNDSLRKLAEFAGEWLRPSGLARKLILGFSCLVLIVIGSISGMWASNDWAQVKIGDKLTLATLAIAFFAAVLALLAYQVSTGSPNLQLGIMLLNQDPYKYKLNYPTESTRWEKLKTWFEFGPESSTPLDEDLKGLQDPDWPSHTLYIWVKNKSRYPAKSPAVIVRFGDNPHPSMGLCWSPPWMHPEERKPRWILQRHGREPNESWRDREEGPIWKDTDLTTSGIVILATQWDGGSTYPIHGKSTRRLPNLSIGNLYSENSTTGNSYGENLSNKFKVELLAEGYRKVVNVTIDFKIHV
jgi:hypothetical protein